MRVEFKVREQLSDQDKVQTQELFLENPCSKPLCCISSCSRMISALVFNAKPLRDLYRQIFCVQETRAPHTEPPANGLCSHITPFPLHSHQPTVPNICAAFITLFYLNDFFFCLGPFCQLFLANCSSQICV